MRDNLSYNFFTFIDIIKSCVQDNLLYNESGVGIYLLVNLLLEVICFNNKPPKQKSLLDIKKNLGLRHKFYVPDGYLLKFLSVFFPLINISTLLYYYYLLDLVFYLVM